VSFYLGRDDVSPRLGGGGDALANEPCRGIFLSWGGTRLRVHGASECVPCSGTGLKICGVWCLDWSSVGDHVAPSPRPHFEPQCPRRTAS
jgi:hypothetical protein